MLRLTLIAFLSLLIPCATLAEVVDRQNTICGPKLSAGRFKLSVIGPRIAGTWKATAPGIGFTTGVQQFDVVIRYTNGRLYITGDGGAPTELKPVYGTRKALRYDPIRQKPLPKKSQAAKASLEDIALITDCEPGIAAQFTWRNGNGANSSGGFYSFLQDKFAIGTMWNSAQGTREVLLRR